MHTCCDYPVTVPNPPVPFYLSAPTPTPSTCRSLAVGHQYSSLGTQPILCGSIPGLVPKQLRFCRNYVEIMPSVAEGVKIGIQECQHQFRGRRWNCTTINDNLAIFGPVLDKGSCCILTKPACVRFFGFIFYLFTNQSK